jgi:glycosyltransferase involved in cell wall biosynthesis
MSGVKDGLKHVTTDYVFFVDSDGQHIASDFWKLYKMKDSYDMIVGKKIKRSDPPHRILISKIFHVMIRCIFRLSLCDPDTAYRLINKKVLDKVTEETGFLKYSFWTEFTVRSFWRGFRVAEVPVIHRKRLKGDTHLYNISKLPHIILLQLAGLFLLKRELANKNPKRF